MKYEFPLTVYEMQWFLLPSCYSLMVFVRDALDYFSEKSNRAVGFIA